MSGTRRMNQRRLCTEKADSCSPNFPFYACDADFLAGFLVVVEPFAFGEIDA
jgi:hypothetical protein